MLQLVPMTSSEKSSFLRDQAEDYAADISKATDISLDKAREKVAEEQEARSPDSEKQFFYHLTEGSTRVGRLWLSHPNTALVFISYLEILMEHRGRGLGTGALSLIKTTARSLGAAEVWLHVFEHNSAAKSLYLKNGFRVSGIQMFAKVE
jgi:ribosomal protein S18 acetylase RimI-like enzyme